MPTDVKDWLKSAALDLGFSACAIASAAPLTDAGDMLAKFVNHGHHGDMKWLADTVELRRNPQALWPGVRSIVMLTTNYGPADDPLADLNNREKGNISCYAKGKDYHAIIKPRLVRLAREMDTRCASKSRAFVDAGPVMEKPLAAASGLGWQGKHTNLVSRTQGSWTFLGTVLTTAVLEPDAPETDHCGACRRCLDVCPTNAFPAPYQLDATKCISYLTIEHKGPIPPGLRKAIGNRIFGCDDCLAVCPWNKFARTAEEIRLHPRPETSNPDLTSLLKLDEESFRQRFAGTPLKRAGRDRFLRNVLIAVGNSKTGSFVQDVLPLLLDPSTLVRGAAVWALQQLVDDEMFEQLRETHLPSEADPAVRREWLNEQRGTTTIE